VRSKRWAADVKEVREGTERRERRRRKGGKMRERIHDSFL